jgi:hypothetical protein
MFCCATLSVLLRHPLCKKRGKREMGNPPKKGNGKRVKEKEKEEEEEAKAGCYTLASLSCK